MSILPLTSKGARQEPKKVSIVTVVISDLKKKKVEEEMTCF